MRKSGSPIKQRDEIQDPLSPKRPILRKREQRASALQNKNYTNFYKRLDEGNDQPLTQPQRKSSFDSDTGKRIKDRRKQKSKQIRKNKLKTLSKKSIQKLPKTAKKSDSSLSNMKEQVQPKPQNGQAVDLDKVEPSQTNNQPFNLSNFFEVIQYYNANRLVKCSEKVFEEIQDSAIDEPFDGQLNQINQNLPSNKVYDAVDLAFPEQPKTQVIAQELLQIQELEQLSKKVSDQNQLDQQSLVKQESHEQALRSETFINCDLRFFNLQYLVDQIGHFEVVQIDPPWRIKGAQRNNTSFMFSNNKFNLDYSTMSNAEIMNIPVEVLSRKGFCFLWILNSQMHIGYECMNKWGYEVVDQLTWIKTKNKKIHISHGFYFLHSSEVCLVGYKCPPNEYIEFKSKVSNNLIVAEIRKKSQKPDQIYTLIDILVPGAKKIELFARNNNLRKGWLSLGNQLGENYLNWKNVVNCDECQKDINTGNKYYKSKIKANYDICVKCFNDQLVQYTNSQGIFNQEEHAYKIAKNQFYECFFLIENATDDEILHEYHQCNICHAEPIWGLRFKCQSCEDCDLCESCFDARLHRINLKQEQDNSGESGFIQISSDDIICQSHEFICIELPLIADGLAAHNQYKCVSCYMRPIIGACFVCADCNHFSLCQNCYFTTPFNNLKVRGHTDKHKIELIVEPRQSVKKYVKCNGCGEMPIQDVRYKCNNCFDFDFCENCYRVYAVDRKELKTVYSTSHKAYHTFTKLILAIASSNIKDYNNNDELEEQKENGESKSGRHNKDNGDKAEKKRPPGRPSNKNKQKKGQQPISLTQP